MASTSSRYAFDASTMVWLSEVVPVSDDAFGADKVTSCQWKSAFPSSIRLSFIVAVAEAFVGLPQVDLTDPTGLIRGDQLEHNLFSNSVSEFEYVKGLNDTLVLARGAIQNPAGLELGCTEEISIPGRYYFTQPVSETRLIVQQLSPQQRNVVVRMPAMGGPFRNLVQRHKDMVTCVEKILSEFINKVNITEEVLPPATPLAVMSPVFVNLPYQNACDALSNSLKKLTVKLNDLEGLPGDVDLQIKLLEDHYAAAFMHALKTFVQSVSNVDTSVLLECHKQVSGHDTGEKQVDPRTLLSDACQTIKDIQI